MICNLKFKLSILILYLELFRIFPSSYVEVENPISGILGTTSLTVVPPAPHNLQVLLRTDLDSVPSCIPTEDTVPVNLPSVAVFLEEEVMLQASVAMGTNLTFVWEFEDGLSYTVSPYLAESGCSRITCMQQHIKNHTFTTEGIQKVSVNVSNSLGSLSKELYVVVVKREMGNLSLVVDDDFEPYYTKPNTAVRFMLTLFTTSRQNTYLEFDFGDRKAFNLSLKDENDTFIGGKSLDSNHLHLMADYGESCTLFLSFQHSYENSGVYYVKSKVFSINVTLEENLEEPIIIQNVISDSQLRVNSSYAIGPVNNFNLKLSPLIHNMSSDWAKTTFRWELFLDNSSILIEKTREPVFCQMFTEVGRYALAVNISNLVSFDYIKKYFFVQAPVDGLSIYSTSPAFISLGSTVHVVASVNNGTNVTFKWDFGGSDVYVAPSPVALANRYQESSSANYTYWDVGSYNITVTAINLVSQLQRTLPNVVTVEQRVSGLSLIEVPPNVLGNLTEIFAIVTEGSHIRFSIDIGMGSENITATVEDDGLFKIVYDFPEPGVYRVTVTAFNDVSSVADEVCVIVQAYIDDIVVKPLSDVFVGQISKFKLTYGGEILDRSDLLFQWSVNGTNSTSVVPFLTHIFYEAIGSVRLEVLVRNLVVEKKVWVEFEVFDIMAPMALNHPFFLEFGKPVLFQIMNMENINYDIMIEIDFGDDNSLIAYQNTSEPLQLTHMYSVPGIYEIKANVTSHIKSTNIYSILSIQERITNISLQGPSISRFIRPESRQIWNVAKTSGTAVLYTWETDHLTASPGFEIQPDVQILTNVLQKECVHFKAAGLYNISVNASNQLSWQVVHIQTQLQQPIITASVSMATVLHGENSTIEIVVQGEGPFTLNVNYGDGETAVYSTQNMKELEFVDSDAYVVYRYTLIKRYMHDGEYTCSVVISNAVSSRLETARGVVEEKISGVQILSDSSSVLQIEDEVTLIATVEKGSNILYIWDFNDSHAQPNVENLGNASIATHIFSSPGFYLPSVSVSNSLQTEPITVTYSKVFHVLNPIGDISVFPHDDVYTTSLHVIDNITMESDPVRIRAECSGTGVTFEFDFGDGSPLVRKEVPDDGSFPTSIVAMHKYHREGSYIISVKAFNKISNGTAMMSRPLVVQIPPLSLQCEQSQYFTNFGDYTNIALLVSGESNLQFNWAMGDQTDYIDQMSVSHQYLQTGNFTVTVVARNDVQSVTAQCEVSVQPYIQGVSIVISDDCEVIDGNVRLCETDTPITFKAETVSGNAIWFNWNMGDATWHVYTNEFDYTYSRNGRYNVTVTAANHNDHAVSEPVMLLVQAPVKKLSIRVAGTTILGTKSYFRALIHSGSDLNYFWDFGDGTTESSTSSIIHHAYNRTGEYFVSVEANNSLSRAFSTERLFVLTQMCKPPVISFIGDNPKMVNRSDTIEIETDVAINCSITNLTKYQWFIRHANNSDFAHNCGELDQRNLYLRKQCLPPEIFTITLEVRMNGTIVHTQGTLELHIVKAPLVAILEGGTQRVVGSNSRLNLMGNYSYDPNEPFSINDDGLKYSWACHPLSQLQLSCFMQTTPLTIATNSTLSFNVSLLNFAVAQEFVFTLRLSKEGHLDATTSQVITVEESDTLQVMLDCPQCVKGELNSNDWLTLEVLCPGCRLDLTYVWKLYIVLDGASSSSGRDSNRCVRHDGIAWNLLPGNQTTTENNNIDFHSHSSPPTPPISTDISNFIGDVPTSPGLNEGRVFATQQQKTTTPDPLLGVTDPSLLSATAIESPLPTSKPMVDNSRSASPESTAGQFSPESEEFEEDSFGLVEDDLPLGPVDVSVRSLAVPSTPAPMREEPLPSIEEDSGHFFEEDTEDIGGAKGIDEDTGEGGGTPTDTDSNSGESDRDDAREFDSVDFLADSILQKDKNPLNIYESNLATTKNGPSLVFKSDNFEEGRTYAVTVEATNEDNHVGQASYYFKINQNPSLGRCSVFPLEGIELSTIFNAECLEWQDTNMPLHYEISYGFNVTENMTILYYGLNPETKFYLPSGPTSMDYEVFVHIAIVDSRGGRTKVCSIPIIVKPEGHSLNMTTAELYNKTVDPGNELQEKVGIGSPQEIYHFSNAIARILNRLVKIEVNDVTMAMVLAQRLEIRHSLLKALEFIPSRTAFEMHISISSVAAVCERPSELSLGSIEVASGIIKEVAKQAVAQHEDEEHLLQLSIDATSGLLSAITMPHLHSASNSTKSNVANSIVDATNLLLKLQLARLVVNQTAISFSTPDINMFGKRLDKLSSLIVKDGRTQFFFPSSMDTILKNVTSAVTTGGSCHDVAMTTYDVNPYQWSKVGAMVTTSVASLELYTCDGLDLVVENLPTGNEIDLTVPHDLPVENSEPGNFTFDKANMNIHEFNVTDMNMQQTLHFTFELSAVAKRELFPLRLVLRWREQPTPYEYDLKWDFENYEETIEEFLPPGFFNETGTYYLALLDPLFDQSMYQFDHPPGHYLFRIWWAECLYWNKRKGAWVPDGCELLPTSNYEVTNCRCNHLTAFGVNFVPIVKLIKRIPMSHFQISNEHPITFVFVVVAFGIYFVLFIYCRYADLHDEKKQGTIFLKDNQLTDQQYYEITIETGFRSGATTTAAVSIVLHGEEGFSETKELKAHDKALFERNSRDRFVVSVPESLGDLTKIHIWHDNAGRSPSWFLSRVAVRDLLSGQKWYFICERWFAVEEDDGNIEREIPVQKTGIGFHKAFFAKGAQYFSDYYLWSSVFTRPPYSCFTRVQRLTVCLSILMDFFCINTIWYQLLDKEEVDLGLIDVSGEAVLVGIVTALIAIPINFPIIMFFRRIRPKTERDPKEIYNNIRQSFKASPDTAVQPILNERSFELGIIEQTALNLQSLQHWTTENWIRKQKGSMGAFDSDSGRSSQERIYFDNGSISSGFEEFGGEINRESDDTKASRRNRVSRTISDSGMSSPECQSIDSFMMPPSQHEMNHKKFTSPKLMFPHWCLYIAYALCFSIIGISTFVAVYLGYRFNHTKAIYWIQSVYFSFLQCVFITQPAVMVMFTIMKSIRHRNNVSIFDHYDDNTDLLSKHEMKQIRTNVFIYGNDITKGIEARRRARYLRFARPPQPKEIQKAKEKTIKEKNMYTILKDVIIYSLILMCLLWMAYGRDMTNYHSLNKSIFKTYVETPRPFTEISSVQEFWTWSQTDLLDGLFWEKWYNGENQTEEQGYVMGGDTILLGKASLRQVRVHQNSCSIAHVMEAHFDSCQGSYAASREDTEDYRLKGEGWFYNSKNLLKRYAQWGRIDHYSGGGYVVDLNTTRSSAAAQLKELQKNAWIDDQTRMVIVEFTLFNAPYRLFSSVALLAEMPGTGAIHPLPKVESVLLYHYESNYDYFILLLELLFLLLVAVSGKREVHKAIKLKLKYFLSLWSWVELSMILLSLMYFVMYVYRFAYVTEIIERMKRTFNEEFVDMSFLAFWDQCLRSIIGAVLFVVTVKFLHLLRFNHKVAMFGAVIQQAFKALVILLVSLLVIQVAFSCLGVLLFGAFYKPFNELFATTGSVITLLVGTPESLDNVQEASPILWTIFYISYISTVFVAFSGLAKAILCCSYRKVKIQDCKNVRGQTVSGREVMTFFWNELLIVLGIRKLPSNKDCEREELPLEFTMAEIEYQVDELLFRMSALTHQHGLPDKHFGYYGDSDNGMEDNLSLISTEPPSSIDSFLEERLERIHQDLYSHNPELRELIEGASDAEDREKQLRSQLELEIFRQLQLVRQEEDRQRLELQDSGRDTQSEQTDMPFDDSTSPPIVRQAFWTSIPTSFPSVNPNTYYMGQLGNWTESSKGSEGSIQKGRLRDDIRLEEFSDASSRMDEWTNPSSSYSELKEGTNALRKSPSLHELTAETSFSHPRLNSARSENVESTGTEYRKRNQPQNIVRDFPEGECPDKTMSAESYSIPNALYSSHEDLTEEITKDSKISGIKHVNTDSDPRNRLCKTKAEAQDFSDEDSLDETVIIESFSIPNALFSSQEDLTDSDTKGAKSARIKHLSRGSDARNRLRKTKSRGKGKGRSRIDLGSGFMNDGFSSDEDVPVIHMGM
ncbi:polycystic kidney disease 1-related protein-like isoform X2 [Anneissia japonica]|uniref:polycystic kidney disease 1-related protein-like isoform X2 n=1 Tax=Anneissia japonica TaxID=1529436 RepID=UPI00142581BA|nr:polycystic kidney disease 1-related protein-like isoform X2 [Anneissia japonica]